MSNESVHLIIKVMKKVILTSIAALLLAGSSSMKGQEWPEEYLGLPGDNLNLYAVMDLFQSSETLEGFEKNLNDENSRINNLDLNGDNLVDYITVSDYVDGNVHNIVLRAALNSREMQDIAVFTVIKLADGGVEIQLIGDEDLYGKNYIVEPIYDETPNPGYTGGNNRSSGVTVIRTSYYDIAAWPMIRYIYRPSYVVWRSSWSWGYWPDYWSPWNPYYWHFYYGYHSSWNTHYYGRYRHWHTYRYPRYREYYYTSVRVYSPVVVVNINNGIYRNTYSRPDERRNGEVFYASTRGTSENRSGNAATVSTQSRRAEVPESARVKAGENAGRRESVNNSSQTRTTNVSNTQVNNGADRRSTSTTVRTNSGNTGNVATQRGNTGTQRSTTATQRSNTGTQRSTTATQRSNTGTQRSTTATQRSNTGTQHSTAATQRSNTGAQRSTVATPKSNTGTQRSTTATQRSNTGTQRSTTATQKSNTGTQRSTTATQRSNTGTQRSTTATQRGNTGAQRSTVATQKSSGSSNRSSVTAPKSTTTRKSSATTQKSSSTSSADRRKAVKK